MNIRSTVYIWNLNFEYYIPIRMDLQFVHILRCLKLLFIVGMHVDKTGKYVKKKNKNNVSQHNRFILIISNHFCMIRMTRILNPARAIFVNKGVVEQKRTAVLHIAASKYIAAPNHIKISYTWENHRYGFILRLTFYYNIVLKRSDFIPVGV